MIRVMTGPARMTCVCGRVVTFASNTIEIPTDQGPTPPCQETPRILGMNDVTAAQFTEGMKAVIGQVFRDHYAPFLEERYLTQFRTQIVDLVEEAVRDALRPEIRNARLADDGFPF